MVKITNKFGDFKTGKQGEAVFQGHYGNQVRRKHDGKKKNDKPQQLKVQQRFKDGLAFASTLTDEEKAFLHEYVSSLSLKMTWHNYAKLISMSVPKVDTSGLEIASGINFPASMQSWGYRNALPITENSGSLLTNFQVLVQIQGHTPAGANYVDFALIKAGGADVRFTKADGSTLLDHWVESWDDVGLTAKIWVEVDSLPASTVTSIFLYYGNPSATYNNSLGGANTFEFYDDFNRTDSASLGANWTEYGDGLYAIASNECNRPDATSGEESVALATAIGVKTDIIIRAKIKTTAFSGTDEQIGIVVRSNTIPGTGYRAYVLIWHENNGQLQLLDARIEWLSSTTKSGWALNDWWFFELSVAGNTIKGKAWKEGSSEPASYDLTATRTTVSSGYVGLLTHPNGVAAAKFDDFIVRKYVSIEPTYTIGAAEQGAIDYSQGSLSVQHPAIKDTELYATDDTVIGAAYNLSNLAAGIITNRKTLTIDSNKVASYIKVKTADNRIHTIYV